MLVVAAVILCGGAWFWVQDGRVRIQKAGIVYEGGDLTSVACSHSMMRMIMTRILSLVFFLQATFNVPALSDIQT
jgi:hypothetical protein